MTKSMYLEDSTMRGWAFLTGDICFQDYGGKWYRQLGDERYHVIELINWREATGEEDALKYNVSLREIDLRVADLSAAMSCCGWGEEDWGANEADPVMLVGAVSSYGQYAPMGRWDGNNYRKLLAEAKRESRRLTSDADYHKEQMSRPVNRLGSTACEMAHGDFQSAVVRGIAEGNQMARIIGKMHGATAEDMDAIGPEFAGFSFTYKEDCE